MGMESDDSNVQVMFEGSLEVGQKALEYLVMDFWAVSVEKANIRRGTLRDSIQADQQDDNAWTVGTDLEYAVWVHEGTEPHTIEGNPWLYWPGAEHPVRRVEHPGYEGNPWFDHALDDVEGRLDEYLEMALSEIEQ